MAWHGMVWYCMVLYGMHCIAWYGKPNYVLKTIFSPRLATVYQFVGYHKSTR